MLNAKVVHPDSGSHNIHDGVEGADLVKVNLIDLFPVNLCLSRGQSTEYIKASLLHRQIQ